MRVKWDSIKGTRKEVHVPDNTPALKSVINVTAASCSIMSTVHETLHLIKSPDDRTRTTSSLLINKECFLNVPINLAYWDHLNVALNLSLISFRNTK